MKNAEEKYYVLEFAPRLDDRGEPPYLYNARELDAISFKEGTLIEQKLSTVRFIANAREVFTDYQFNITMIPLVSDKLRESLAEIEIKNIQYIPVRIETKKHKIIRDDFSIANITEKVNCFDWGHSVYDDTSRSFGHARRIEKLQLNTSQIKGNALFRLAEAPRILIVSDSVRRHLDRKGISGIKYTNIADYNDLW